MLVGIDYRVLPVEHFSCGLNAVDMILSNHTDWDRSKINLPLMAKRAPGSPNPYIVGSEGVRRFMKVAEECAAAKLMRLN